jgi:hypothetical protein
MSWLNEIEKSTTLRYAMKLGSVGLKIPEGRMQDCINKPPLPQ